MVLVDFLKELEAGGDLLRVGVGVSPFEEIAELTDRQSKSSGGGHALLFEDTGTDFPVATNIMGSYARVCKALRVNDLSEVERRIDDLLGGITTPRHTVLDKLQALSMLGALKGLFPRRVGRRGACREVEMEVDLSQLPVLTCAPHDAAPFFTLPLVHTVDPDTGAQNVGMYRMQVIDNQTTGMHWHRHKTGANHYEKYKARGERMPVVVCLGGDPVYTYCATAPLPEGIDEYMLAGFLRREAVNLVKTTQGGIVIPEDVDFVLEGYVDPSEAQFWEGPFGDHTGFYSLEDFYPRFHITRLSRRRGAIFPATLVGVPPMEDFYLALATERIFISPIRFALAPEVLDMTMPACGVAHNIVIVTIRKSYPGQAFKVASALWGAGQMSFNKFMIVVSRLSDDHSDVYDRVLRALETFDPARDCTAVRGTLDVLDHATDTVGFGGKMCIDLTEKLPEEVGCGGGEADGCPTTKSWEVLHDPALAQARVSVIVDRNVPIDSSLDLVAWLAGASCDPVRDITISKSRMVIDARAKIDKLKRHPNVVCRSRRMVEFVDARWSEYGLGAFIPSPSDSYASLMFSDSAQIK